MELWIRSQDRKTLTKVSNIEYYHEKGNLYTNVNGNYYVGTYYDNLKILGKYKTKERALEVLDEIQKLDIENNPNIKVNIYAYNLIQVIYEMPKE